MSHKQQLMLWLGGGLLLLTAIVTGVMLLFQREPEPEQPPSESTALTTMLTTSSTTTTAYTTSTTNTTTTTETTFSDTTTTISETSAQTTSAASGTSTAAVTTSTAMHTTIITETTYVTTVQTTQIPAQTDAPATEPPATEAPAADPPATEAPATEPPAAEPAAPTYIDGVLIVNKSYPLPKDYNPGLDPTCKAQFDLLSQAAAAEGLNIWLASGFRSYDYQARIYNNYLNWYGQEKTDTLSARAGHSEHQTGLAIDVNSITDSFGSTPEAAWLAEHAHEFGFIIRYPKGKEHITGYKYEPWHIRYLGVDMATTIYNSGLTLEEYFGITSCYAE